MVYLSSFICSMPSSGYEFITFIALTMGKFSKKLYKQICKILILGVFASVLIQILSSPDLHLKDIADKLHWVFLLFPHYCLVSGILQSSITFTIVNICKDAVEKCVELNSAFTEDYCWDMVCHSSSTEAYHDYCCGWD